MPVSEKEYNGNLFDQLSIVERLDKAHRRGEYEQESETIKKEITRKLYQEPPLISE